MKRLAIFAAFFLAVTPVQAGPKDVLKKIAKAAVVWGAPVGTSLLATKGGYDCRARNHSPEHCTAGYGELGQTEAWRGGISFAMSATTYGCLKETRWKGCYGVAAGQSAYNLFWWRHEEGIRRRP
jgi:hypothetical protein